MAEDTEQLDDIEAERQARYEQSRRSSEQVAAMRRIDAAGYKPPGSPTQFLGRESQLLGPRTTDEFGIPLPTPRGAVGLRGYPTVDEYAAASANDAAQAKQNLLESDVSSVSTKYPSTPKFQMPSTDQLIDAGIQAKRDQLQNEINTRKVHLGILPPSAIGASATTLDSDEPRVIGGNTRHPRYAPSQAAQTRAELAILERSASGLDRAQAEVIRQNSHAALQNAKDNETFAQDVARGQVVHFLNNIDETRYPHGSDDRQKFIGKVFGNRPDWLHVMAKDPHLYKYVNDHIDAQDKVGQTLSALKTLYPDEESLPNVGGVRMVPNITSKGGVSWRGSTKATPEEKEQATLEARLHAQTGLTPDEFAAIDPSQVNAGGIVTTDANGKKIFHMEGGGFNANGTPKGQFSNDFTDFIENYKAGETKVSPEDKKKFEDMIASSHAIQIDTGKGYKSAIPRQDFERYKEAFGGGGTTKQTTGKKAMSLDDYAAKLGIE